MSSTPRILLHMCCGPCSVTVIDRLKQAGFAVTGLFYNPNIHPLTEYLKRRDGAAQAAEALGINIIFRDEPTGPQLFLRDVAHRESNRCFYCYSLRIKQTRNIAAHGHFDCFTTTLLYSRYQKHEMIQDVCRDAAAGSPVAFHYEDFRDGWQEGIDRSKAMGLYRQPYCGCIYSEYERYEKQLKKRIRAMSSDG
ncbi:epoxyqueuosine reductase QueH [Desulfovibrio inopinatus]|uniref:epoxyqueuosine reductase QueH n=1 Tax=Desulfovibrio inopinatus TaxID=102109 RepID=UPI0003F97870|nr:epoxyqueuosine reductase QueH [Desulfovibrio inopinatus]